jgi:hypothetical protein
MNVSLNAAHHGQGIRGNHGDSKRALAGGDHRKPSMLMVDEDTSFVTVRTADLLCRIMAHPETSA